VFQDVRGKYGSEGDYVMTPPPTGPLNPTGTDDTTDAWDTIDWLVKNVPESNGKVGMIGSSYEGFTVVMALLDPHPALKVAAPESPMVDGWMGDDWFHYGAFRQINLDYFTEQTTVQKKGRRHSAAESTTTTPTSLSRARPATLRATAGSISSPSGARSRNTRRTTSSGRIRRWTNHGQGSAEGARAVGAGPVGPGGYVGRQPLLMRRWNRRIPTTI
jgi:putative CocE/NonD family hydrolase